jgi:Tol biopolymer transport system component
MRHPLRPVLDAPGRGDVKALNLSFGDTNVARVMAWGGDRLLHVTAADGRMAIAAMIPEGGAPQEVVATGYSPATAPDGRIIVFTSDGPGDRAGLWKVDSDGRHAVQLVPGHARLPVVTADGRRVVFVSNRSGVQSPWSVSLDGGLPTQLANVFAYCPDVSPDGKSLLFGATNARGQLGVCDLPDCTMQRALTTLPGGPMSRWTPDGRGIAYFTLGRGGNLWVQPLAGSPAHQLTHFTDDRTIEDFAWSRDGKRLAIARGTVTNDIVLFRGLRR